MLHNLAYLAAAAVSLLLLDLAVGKLAETFRDNWAAIRAALLGEPRP